MVVPPVELIRQPAGSRRLGDLLMAGLAGDWTNFRAAVAFVKSSGVRHLAESLAAFGRSGRIDIVVGIDHGGTSYEGLRDLMAAAGPNARLAIFHNRLPYTFHPKVYLFKSRSSGEIFMGSGNLTEGGLFTNYEAGVRLGLDLGESDQAAVLEDVEGMLNAWADPASGTVSVLDENVLEVLLHSGLVPAEADLASERRKPWQPTGSALVARGLFEARTEQRAPGIPGRQRRQRVGPGKPDKWKAAPEPAAGEAQFVPSRFVMTLQKTDVGVGQTSAGTARRSPEIFVPLSARDANPGFWEWPAAFEEDPTKRGKFDRKEVRTRFAGRTVTINMMTWPDKHDFRLRCTALRDAGEIGDILKMEKVEPGLGYEYYVEIIPQGLQEYGKHLFHCTQKIPGKSRKSFGYF